MAYTPNNPNGSALSASSAPVVIASDQLAISTKDTIVAATIPTATTMQNAAVAIGVGVNLNVQGYASAIISISGTMSGSTIVFKESPDDVTFNPIAAHQIGISGNLSSTATTIGEYRISCAGLKSLQAVITVFGTGTITVKGFASPLAGHGTTVNANIIASLPAGTNSIGLVGSSSATGVAVPANAFYMGINAGGTNLGPINSISNNGDQIPGTNAIQVGSWIYNGSNWDRNRNNEAVTLLASAARTVTATSADLFNYNGAAYLDVILDMTVVGTGSVTVTINGKDPASGKYYNILSGAAVITNVTNVYRVGISRTAIANATANDTVPRIFQIVVTANNVNTATYSVGYNLSRG